jgi:hypothetical protein
MRCRNFLRYAFIDYVITRIADAKISDSEPQEHEIREADIQWNRPESHWRAYRHPPDRKAVV